ncbi:cystatin isoform X2 [Maylandia zebra]|uniref:Cystatin domain-containing protein n=1 Tax=Astatotilapia calliptera TaxID=8154 RepID=A0A3P8R8G7_ASTCA|nr:cystatin-like [Astatotilapia calliptera]XP_026045988.1 cystatin-like [Astatotilapia calliptera]
MTGNRNKMWKVALTVLAAALAVGYGTPVGGLTDADINNEDVQNALHFAVIQHNRDSNDLYIRQVVEVIKVQSQVVAGMKYVITVKMVKTPCRKYGVDQVCAIHTDQAKFQPYQCTFEVWSRPWLNSIELLKNECQH